MEGAPVNELSATLKGLGFVLYWVCLVEKATLLLLSIGPARKAFHNAFNVGLNKGTSYQAGMKHCFDFIRGQVLSRASNFWFYLDRERKSQILVLNRVVESGPYPRLEGGGRLCRTD